MFLPPSVKVMLTQTLFNFISTITTKMSQAPDNFKSLSFKLLI